MDSHLNLESLDLKRTSRTTLTVRNPNHQFSTALLIIIQFSPNMLLCMVGKDLYFGLICPKDKKFCGLFRSNFTKLSHAGVLFFFREKKISPVILPNKPYYFFSDVYLPTTSNSFLYFMFLAPQTTQSLIKSQSQGRSRYFGFIFPWFLVLHLFVDNDTVMQFIWF